jgi:hypothetical protein
MASVASCTAVFHTKGETMKIIAFSTKLLAFMTPPDGKEDDE